MSETLTAMLDQYKKNTVATTNKSEASKDFSLKNYFTTHLADKQDSATKRIRILPTKDGTTPFVEVNGHRIQVNGEYKTFICPKVDKKDCPFCEAREALLATGQESDKELAKKYSAKKMYVVKIIDRDDEAHGIKFWRFNHDYRKTGTLDKIYGVLQAVNKDITHPETGRDLLIMVARDQNKRPVVQSISHVDPSPLSEDETQKANWLADGRTWEDVYAVKSYDYLEIIVKGGTPVWDKEAKKFVDKESTEATTEATSLNEELSIGSANVKPKIVTSTAVAQPVEPSDTEEEDTDDLPF